MLVISVSDTVYQIENLTTPPAVALRYASSYTHYRMIHFFPIC